MKFDGRGYLEKKRANQCFSKTMRRMFRFPWFEVCQSVKLSQTKNP